MSNNLNQLTMQGNTTKESDLRYTPSGQAVLSIDLATNREWKDENGAKQEKTTYSRWALWGKRAEGLAKYLPKGTAVILSGRLEPADAYADKEGKPRATNRATVVELYFQTGKSAGTTVRGEEPAADADEVADF